MMPRKSRPFRLLRKRLTRLWLSIRWCPQRVAYWALDTAEDWLIGALEAINRRQYKMGKLAPWDD
jgi:hypothetical protein